MLIHRPRVPCSHCPDKVLEREMDGLLVGKVLVRKLETSKPSIGGKRRILPQPARGCRAGEGPATADANTSKQSDGFFDAFGPTGILLFVAASVSVCWTVSLIILTISPNETANYLMDTAEFDDGHFWLIVDPEPALMTVNGVALTVLAVSYAHVMLKMTMLRSTSYRVVPAGIRSQPPWISRLPYGGRYLQNANTFWLELTGYYGLYRKFWNVFFKAGDIIVGSIQLHHLLEAGFSASLCYGYAGLIAISCLSQSFFILHPIAHSAFTEVLVDTVFDMTFAIVCPIFLLVYSYAAFDLDRELARLNLEIYPKGSFELQARMLADPIVTTLFRFCFDALRTLTWLNLSVRLAMNTSFCFRLSRLVEVLSQRRKKLQKSNSKLAKLNAQYAVPRWVGALILAASAFVIVYTTKSITESQETCGTYPQCVAFAYRWDNQDRCPCLAIVDMDPAPKTYNEWIHPVDVTETVRELAKSGDLQVLQLTNRQMEVWPDELQRCVDLKHLSLYYTGVEVIPDWFNVFHKLEFLVFQGKYGERNIVRMPPNAFSRMGSLTFLHFGYLQLLPDLPSFEGLHNLKSLSLALLYTITEMPELKHLVKLQRLELVALGSVQAIPDLSSNKHLVGITVMNVPACCNSFIGDCSLTNPICRAEPEISCLPRSERCSEANRAIFADQPAVCGKNALYFPPPPPIAQEQVDMCGGVLYRECRDPRFQSPGRDVVGICINSYFQVISCTSFGFSASGRRQEIARGLGLPCDPIEEAWLGCSS